MYSVLNLSAVKIFLVLSGLILFPAIYAKSQTTVTLTADRDNTIYRDLINNSNGRGDIFAGTNSMGPPANRRGLLRFNIAGAIPSNATITNVELTLTVVMARTGSSDIAIRRLSSDWGEANSFGNGQGGMAQTGDATWNESMFNKQLWDTPGGDFVDTDSAVRNVGGNGSYTWGSTASMVNDVQMWLNTPANNFGWIIIGNEKSSTTAKRFASRENATNTARPSLAITYIESTQEVSIKGSVKSTYGRPISNAKITLTDKNGVNRVTYTASIGSYRFEGLPINETYNVSVEASRYIFQTSTQTITTKAGLNEVDFVTTGKKPHP